MRGVMLAGVVTLLLTFGGATTALARDDWSGGGRHVMSATVRNADGERVGEVRFRERRDTTSVVARFRHLSPGIHGFHVHSVGRCDAPGFTTAGGHLNPTGATHPNHAGDMSTLLVNADGTGTVALETDRFSVSDLRDVDGSAVIVHGLPDNYANIPTDRYDPDPDDATLSTGDAGGRIACGSVPPKRRAPCVRGMAASFPCHKVDLLYHFPMNEIGGGLEEGTGRGSDVWGWTDPKTGREYVLAGRENGTAIVDITDPRHPVYLANLPTSAIDNRIWRDIKVYASHAFIVSESLQHGMQVLDLTRLRDIDRADAPVNLTADAVYKEFETAHNIAINEESGFAYAVGTRNLDRSLNCQGGLHMIDIRDPENPTFAGCFGDEGYVHDTQCVIYRGPDARFRGREICVNSNPPGGGLAGPDYVSIVDVTDKTAPVLLSRTPYAGNSFSHQGWLTEDQAFFLHGDEGDELEFGHPTRTLVWDVRDLTAPAVVGTYLSSARATDHNMYVKNRYVFQSNYRAGLRVLDLRKVAAGDLREVAFFDVYPPNDDPGFSFGTWSNYPFFDSGVVAVHGYQGLWLLKPRLGHRSS